MPKKPDHRRRFADPTSHSSNVVALSDKMYGAFIEKNDLGFDKIVFRIADKRRQSVKPIDVPGSAPWSSVPHLMQPLGDAVFALARGSAKESLEHNIADVGVFFTFINTYCGNHNVDGLSFGLGDLLTIHLHQYIKFLNTTKGSQNKLLSNATKVKYYRTIIRVFRYLQRHAYYKKQLLSPALFSFPPTPWKNTDQTSEPKEALSVAALAQLQDACEIECRKWLDLRVTAHKLSEHGETLLAAYGGRRMPSGMADEDRLSMTLAYLKRENNLCDYLIDRTAWQTTNYQMAGLIRRSIYNSFHAILPYMCATARTLMPFYLLMAIKTAFNRTTLDDLTIWAIRDSSIFPDSVVIEARYAIVGEKKRSVRDQIRTYKKNDPDDPLNPQALAKHVIELTESIRAIAHPDSKNKMFVYPQKAAKNGLDPSADTSPVRHPTPICHTFHSALDDFIRDNNLQKFRIDQIRPTMNNFSDIILGGDIVQQKALLNHSAINVTDRHYTSSESRLRQRERLAELQNHRERLVLTNGKYDPRNLATTGTRRAITLGFECSDPYESPVRGQQQGRACDAYGACPPCPLASVNTGDPGAYAYLLRFDKSIEDGKPNMHALRWLHVWQPRQNALHRHMAKFTDPIVLSDARKMTFRPLPPVE